MNKGKGRRRYKSKYEYDIVTKTVVREYRYYSDEDGKYSIPAKHRGAVRYGDSLRTMAVALYDIGVMSIERIREMLNAMSGNILRISDGFFVLPLRVVRFKLLSGEYEALVTNLPVDDFSPDELKKLYFRRWGIETSFRHLKYTVGLSKFHAKKASFVTQEIWARLISYNFTSAAFRGYHSADHEHADLVSGR